MKQNMHSQAYNRPMSVHCARVLFKVSVCTDMLDVGYSVHSSVNTDLLLYR